MKQLLLLPIIILLITITGCEKDPVTRPSPTTPIQPPPPPQPPPQINPVNTAPKAYAGFDVWVPLPANSTVLYGYARDAETYSWKKVSGPSSFTIDNSQSHKINVTNLEKGTYEFELTVTAVGLTLKDTVNVDVYEPRSGANEFVFKNLRWMCPMGCSLNIEKFNLYIPDGTTIKVFMKIANSSNWVAVPDTWGGQYMYGISNDYKHFYIYADYPDDEENPVDVKITF